MSISTEKMEWLNSVGAELDVHVTNFIFPKHGGACIAIEYVESQPLERIKECVKSNVQIHMVAMREEKKLHSPERKNEMTRVAREVINHIANSGQGYSLGDAEGILDIAKEELKRIKLEPLSSECYEQELSELR